MHLTEEKKARAWAWLLASLWLTLIYSTLHIARPISEFLRSHLPFEKLAVLSIILILLSISFFFWKSRVLNDKFSIALLLLILACYATGLSLLRFPEEKLHFIQYGVLAFLIFRALAFDLKKLDCYLGSLLLTTCLGWLDEKIQDILPDRVYDELDVLLNFASALLALGLVFVFKKADTRAKNKDPLSSDL